MPHPPTTTGVFLIGCYHFSVGIAREGTMAKAKSQAYQVTDKSPLSYNGKEAACGDVVTDLPGESITWLLADGFIVAAETADEPVTPEPENTPDETPAEGEQ